MDTKHVYIVTHGKKFSGPNPGMTEEGFDQVAKLRNLLPGNISEVVCGTGLRHIHVSHALRLEPTRYTSAVGGPDSGEATVPGRPVDVVILPDGTKVPYAIYTTLIDGAIAVKALVASLPHNSVICAGRPSMIMFGMDEAVSKGAAVYRLEITPKPVKERAGGALITRHKAGEILAIKEIAATGEIEIHTV